MAWWNADKCGVDDGGGGASGGEIEADTCYNDVLTNCMDPLTSEEITMMIALSPAVMMQRKPRCPFGGPGRDALGQVKNGNSMTLGSGVENGYASSSWSWSNGSEEASCGRQAEVKTANDLNLNVPSMLTAAQPL